MVPNCPDATLSWCQIVRCQIVRGAKLSWCQIVLGLSNLIWTIIILPHSQGAWRTLLWHIQHFLGLCVPEGGHDDNDDDEDDDEDDDDDDGKNDIYVITSGTTTLRLTSRLVLLTELTYKAGKAMSSSSWKYIFFQIFVCPHFENSFKFLWQTSKFPPVKTVSFSSTLFSLFTLC